VALEYLNQEVVRFFNACSNQLTSSVLLFIRQSFWPILIFGAHLFNHSVNLSLIFSLWAISNLIVLLTSFFFVRKFYQKSVFNSFNFNWIKKGLIFAFFFFLSAISFKALFTVDRNYISNYFSNEVLSAYGFYFALSALLMSIIEPLIFSFFLVDVIKLAESGNITKIRSEIIKYTMQILCVSIGLFLVVFWGSNFLLEILERDSFKYYINLFYIFLTIQTFWAISILFQYVLYSFHKDIVNILSNVISFLVFLALIIPFGVQFGYVGIPVFILIAILINLVVKGFYYLKTIYF
jgi:O-antigen/teichoic acid export membrane protein